MYQCAPWNNYGHINSQRNVSCGLVENHHPESFMRSCSDINGVHMEIYKIYKQANRQHGLKDAGYKHSWRENDQSCGECDTQGAARGKQHYATGVEDNEV